MIRIVISIFKIMTRKTKFGIFQVIHMVSAEVLTPQFTLFEALNAISAK
jgi:hypothetical protein